MAQTVDISFVPALQNQIINLYQEAAGGLRSTVRVRNITGKTDKWERLGGVELEQVTTRHQQTPHTPMVHSVRGTPCAAARSDSTTMACAVIHETEFVKYRGNDPST